MKTDAQKIFWVSWIQNTEDHRPMTFPPNEAILGWWCSGRGWNDDAVLVALVRAEDENGAMMAVQQDWPEFEGDWRFIKFRPTGSPLSDRFPINDWMKPRLKGVINNES